MAEKRGLGRGLSALLGEAETAGMSDPSGLRTVPVEFIHRNERQPRFLFDEAEIDELAASIREKGVLQPILVRPARSMEGHFEIVAGERRWRAAQKAGLRDLPVMVRELEDSQVLEIAIIENVQRAALNPIEEATAYLELIERHGRTQAQVAEAVSKSRVYVANAVRLLNLPPLARAYVMDGRISAGHARALLGAGDPAATAERIVQGSLSVRATEQLVRREGEALPRPRMPGKTKGDADTLALQTDLSEVLGLEVEVRDRNGAGEVRIVYKTLDQLDEICRRLTRG